MSAEELEPHLERLQREYLPRMIGLIDEVAVASSPAGSTLVDMLRYHFETGGKRLRGVLPLMVAELLGGDAERTLPFGAACEMLHNATLVHDDLQDEDTHRRGRPTVWRRFGAPQAINLGDAMFYYTLMLIRRTDASADLREALYERAMVDTLAVIDGQELEFALKTSPEPTLEDYFAMVDGKTSALMALSLSGGAMLAGSGEQTIEPLREMAHHLGILFQVQDDVLDVYGDKGRERAGEDVAEGKRSLLAVHALGTLNGSDREELRSILDRPREATSAADIEAAKQRFDEARSLEFAVNEMDRRRNSAVEAAARTGNRNLVRLANYLAELFSRPISGVRPRKPRSDRATSDDGEPDGTFLVRMLPEVSRTFALSIEALPEPLRSSVRTAYLLCRIVDTIEDSPHIAPERRQLLFARFESAFEEAEAARDLAEAPEWRGSDDPDLVLCRGAVRVFSTFAELEPDLRAALSAPILEMSSGMSEYCRRADRDGRLRIESLEDLDRYCYFVAGTVGKMLTELFCWYAGDVDADLRSRVRARAVQFGQGLQLVNVLKDVSADHGRGVCYLPEDALSGRGLDRADVLRPEHRARALEVVAIVADRARAHLERAVEYTLSWPADRSHDVRFFCSVPLSLALATLGQVERGDETLVAGREPKVPRGRVVWIYEEARAAVSDNHRLRDLFRNAARAVDDRAAPAATSSVVV